MRLSDLTVLSPDQRIALGSDESVGGGNLLASALTANPRPDAPFVRLPRPIVDERGEPQLELSLLQLDRLAQSWSAWYLRQGVRPRDRVAVYIDDSFAYSVHFYALAQIGAIAVLVNSRAPREIAVDLCVKTAPVGLLTDHERLHRLGDDIGRLTSLRWVTAAEEMPAPPAQSIPDSARFRHDVDDPVTILHSSGTTGSPKATIHTHRSIAAGPRYRLVSDRAVPGAVMMTALPQSHLGCIAYTTYAVLSGTPLIALRDVDGDELAAAVAEHRPTNVMAFAHAYAELAALDVEPRSLDSVDIWVTIGDAIHEAHIKRILALRSEDLPEAAFYDRLGTTELGWGVLLNVRTLSSERSDRCVGRPVGVAEVVVLRPDGSPAGPGEYGLLGARGPAITPGYWNDSDMTYRSRLAGYWLTGDVAFRDDDGYFFQVDRATDALHTSRGTGYSVFMEEVLLSELRDLVDCAVVGGALDGTTVPVAVVVTKAADPDPCDLLATANTALRAAGHPELGMLEIATTEEDFPVGVTGKVLKRTLKEKYADLEAHACEQDSARLLAIALPGTS